MSTELVTVLLFGGLLVTLGAPGAHAGHPPSTCELSEYRRIHAQTGDLSLRSHLGSNRRGFGGLWRRLAEPEAGPSSFRPLAVGHGSPVHVF